MNKKFIKSVGEKLIEGLLTLSGGITSLIVLLIVIFLFKEGAGLFSRSTLGRRYGFGGEQIQPIKQNQSG